MKTLSAVLAIVACFVAVSTGLAQDLLLTTDSTEIFVSSGGRLVMDNPTTARGMNRWAYLNLAVSSTNVFNWDDSVGTVVAAFVDSTSSGRKADYVVTHVSNPASGTLGSSIVGTSPMQVTMKVYVWKHVKGAVLSYRYRNVGTTSYTGKVAFELYPRIDQSYGGHSLRWRSQDSTVYYFRSGVAHYLGARYLSGGPTGVKLSTGARFFQPGITSAESQPDSVRFSAAQYAGFDVAVDSGGTTSTPRSMIHVNNGSITLAPNDSSQPFYYAMAYEVSESGMLQKLAGIAAQYRANFPASVEQTDATIPLSFALRQNYPNPFNPVTTIEFDILEAGRATLKVYTMLGQEAATLVDGDLGPGTYRTHFDGSDLASGLYFYRLTAGKTSATRTMMLAK